jgi:hypothetical protein
VLSVVWRPKSGQRGLTASMRTTGVVPGLDELGRQPAASAVVHTSGCAPTLLYGVDAYYKRQEQHNPFAGFSRLYTSVP